MIYQPVRRVTRLGPGPLHIGVPTGRGYRTACGRTLTGADLDVPRPRFNLGRRHLEDYWSRCWALERTCRACARLAEHDDRALRAILG